MAGTKSPRFRIVTFRDNETWTDGNDVTATGRTSSSRALVVKSGDLDKQQPVIEHRISTQAMLQDSRFTNDKLRWQRISWANVYWMAWKL